jgi:plasmid replication initiation protein
MSAIEINLLYFIVGELQQKMELDFNREYKEERITLELKKIDNNKNYSRIKEALKKLRIKEIEFTYNIPNSKKIKELNTSILSGFEHEINSKYITIDIPSKMSKFLCYIGGGYTTFQKVIAINLTSIFSKKMYDFCCRWITKGPVFKGTIEKFKEFLNIQDKYHKISHLQDKVLKVAEKELKNKADLFFTYSFQKTGRKFTHITLVINKNVKTGEKFMGVKSEIYSKVYITLRTYFPDHENNSARFYTDRITDLGYLEKIHYRLLRLDDQFSNGTKTKRDIRNLLLHKIFPEFNIAKKPPTKKSMVIKQR